jgi:hypothetical protein
MAVVQISRIQQRRGKKNSGTGFPQLASGEIGWAIDTQELYIGNGSVSEGSPYVGNTQILTEHVNILDFVGAYQYQRQNPVMQTGPTPLTPVRRTIQQRLDDTVSVVSFIDITKKIGINDVTEDLQRAIDQLFLNDATQQGDPTSRVILYFQPGEYLISEELRLPPYTYIMGSGIDSTTIHLTGSGASGVVIRTVDSGSEPGSYTSFESMDYEKRPQYIIVENLTLKTSLTDAVLLLDNLTDSIFQNVKFKGIHGVPQNVGEFTNALLKINPAIRQAGVYSRSTSGVHNPENVQFVSCIFENTGFGFLSESDHNNLCFLNCKFYQLYDAIIAGDEVYGAVNTTISNSYFDQITRYGIWIKKGFGNTSDNNKFILVGNNGEGHGNPTYPIIRYDTPNNQSMGDFFERNNFLKDQTVAGQIAFYPNIKSTGLIVDPTNFIRNVENTPVVAIEFLRFPLWANSTYIIDYVIVKENLGEAVRTGTIRISVEYDRQLYHIHDDYSYTGSATVENIEFSAALENFDSPDAFNETLIVKLFNPTGNGTALMNYSYKMLICPDP